MEASGGLAIEATEALGNLSVVSGQWRGRPGESGNRRLVASRVLRFDWFHRIRILLVRIVIAWFGCLLHSEVFGCHLKGPARGIH
jgi:hypothetical protein